ncbi:MAG: polysaccharide biosynthesis C-terminal domain-containing protein [Erysipelotrichaceae bacterium]|nr:polysaccharide biosynthesis C-terminal domain-containing protein [Erysipelotrichaceae bacterium]
MFEKLKPYIGSKDFYGKVTSIAIPLGLQQLITSCMGIIDSLMVSWIGEVTAVGTAAQIETLCISTSWAIAAAIGIFTVQFFGAQDYKQLKKSFGLSMVLGVLCGLLWFLIATLFGKQILSFYVQDSEVVSHGLVYLKIVKYSYLFLSIEYAFNITYRSIQKPRVPLMIGISSILINIITNYLLIFGMFGFPKLGIQGAALGTCMAHGSTVLIHIVYAYKTHQIFIGSISEMFSFSKTFVIKILSKIYSMLFNELFFGFGSTLFIRAFGILGVGALEAYYVGAKISDVFYAFANGFSNAIESIIGVSLGANNISKAKKEGKYLISFAMFCAIGCFAFVFNGSELLVSLFHLSSNTVVREADLIVKVFALKIALRFFVVIIFASLRAGGDLKALTLLDSGMMWGVGIPLAFICVYVFHIESIALVFMICQLEQIMRVVLGMRRYSEGQWAVNLTHCL